MSRIVVSEPSTTRSTEHRSAARHEPEARSLRRRLGLGSAERGVRSTTSGTSLRVARSLVVAFALALVLIVVNQLLRWHAMELLQGNHDRLTRTQEVLGTTEGLRAALQGAESAHRGFLLSRDPRILSRYEEERAHVPRFVGELEALTRDDAVRATRVRALTTLTDRKLRHMQRSTELALEGQLDSAEAAARSGSGFRLMQGIQQELDAIRTSELQRLAAREAQSERAWRVNALSALVSAVLNVGLLVGLFLLFRRDMRSRAKSSRHLSELLSRERTAHAEAEKARAEAERANRHKDEFLATISHELRTPLAAVLGWAELLREPRGRARLGRGLDVIERNARAQTRMVEDLLDLSLLSAGRMELDRATIDLGAVLRAAVGAHRAGAAVREQTLELDLGASEELAVSADPARLTKAIESLVSNAIKFTPRGGRVRVSARRDPERVCIIVEDTGQGLAPKDLARVFDRFEQADGTARRRHGGLGIGLAIAKRIAELHGGTVTAESAGVGQGAMFTLSLPTADDPAARTA